MSLHFSTKKHTTDIFLPINVDMFEDFYNIKSCNSRHMPVYFLSSFPINKFSRCRALSPEVLRQREDGGVSPSPVFEKLSCIVFHKMKLILRQVRFDKLLPVLSDVKLETPEFKSQNPKNSEKIRKIQKKSGKIQKKFRKNPRKMQKIPQKIKKIQKILEKIRKSPEKLSESGRSVNTGYFLLQNFWNVGFYKLTSPLSCPQYLVARDTTD